MEVLSWNVQGAFPFYVPTDRVEKQLQYIEETVECPDIIALNEVSRFRRELLVDGLQEIGYTEIVHTLDWAEELGESDIPPYHEFHKNNGNLTAVHEDFRGQNLTRSLPSIQEGPWGSSELKDWDTNMPEKILHATVDVDGQTLDLWNVRAVPGNMYGEEKIKIFENVYERIRKGCEQPCILSGDFNAPKDERVDGAVVPWRHDKDGALADRWVRAERNILRGLDELEMVDVFREQHGYGELDTLDTSHATQTDDPLAVPPEDVEGKRFDHMIASTNYLTSQACHYNQAGFRCSDHAPLIAEFTLSDAK
jgi:exonuclease III